MQTPAAVSAQHRNRSQFRLYKYKRREASRPWLFALLHPHIAQNLPIRRRNPGRSAFSPEIPSWGRKFPKKAIFTLEETQPDHGTRNFPDRFFRSLCPRTAARHGPLCARHGAGVEPLPAAVVDTRQVRHRGGGRMGRANEGRRRDRAVLQHGQRRSVPRKRHHRHRSGFQEAFHDDPQHHRAAPPCRPHGRGVFPEKGVPQLRLLRDAGHRLLGRTLPGFPRDRRTGKPRFHLLVTAQRRPERPVVLRHGAAHHMAAIAAQTGGHHGLRRQPGVPYHRGVPPDRGGGIRVFRTT